MEDTDHGINAIKALNGIDINGRKLDVKIASPKSNRPAKKTENSPLNKVNKKPFKKIEKTKRSFNENKTVKPNPVERDSEGKVIRKTE